MTTISTTGGNSITITESGGSFYYTINNSSPNPITWPVTVTNTNTATGFVKVLFASDITLTSTGHYFICGSDYIQFGSESLNSDGSRTTITVSVDNYDGLIQNGSLGVNGANYIYVYNIFVDGTGHTTQIGAGWLGQKYFGLGTTNNTILNCSSAGTIYGGGILGEYAEHVTLIGCSSSGDIQDTAGGIVAQYANALILQMCWSTGAMAGDGVGGIVGSNSISVEVTQCYSEGDMVGNNTGGIVGSNAGSDSVTITNCYSRGVIQGANAGGICGSLGPDSGTFSVTIVNCYSTGNVINSNLNATGGICGLLIPYLSGTVNLVITNCYTTGTCGTTGYIIGNETVINGVSTSPKVYVVTNTYSEAGSVGGVPGSWSNAHANLTLTNTPSIIPGVGTTWVANDINEAYELNNFGYTPYSTTIISSNTFVQSLSQTIQVGGTSQAGLVSAVNSYSILAISGGDSNSYNTITINTTTGAISTTAETVVGTYILVIRRTGSYYITTYFLTISPAVDSTTNTCCAVPMDLIGLDYTRRFDYITGNQIVIEHQRNPTMKFDGYSQFLKYKMALASRHG